MNCPLCNTEGALLEPDDQGFLVSCPSCSEYSITRSAVAQWQHSRGAHRTGPLQLAWVHLARERSTGQLPAIRLDHVWGWAVPPSRPPSDTAQ
jgi:predicted RNA-binding Zn-ribbon protein involved in translation (DUF1610 family)